jgi:hypothetical protein
MKATSIRPLLDAGFHTEQDGFSGTVTAIYQGWNIAIDCNQPEQFDYVWLQAPDGDIFWKKFALYKDAVVDGDRIPILDSEQMRHILVLVEKVVHLEKCQLELNL